jgi:lysozyme
MSTVIDRSKLPIVEFPLQEFEQDLIRDEGRKLVPYKDSRGFWTVGIGHFIGTTLINSEFTMGKPISAVLCEYLFKEDVKEALYGLDKLVPWWRTLSPVRQRVLANMCFNMGPRVLATFGATLDLIEQGSYRTAATHMLNSRWHQQVPNRALRLECMMRDDKA